MSKAATKKAAGNGRRNRDKREEVLEIASNCFLNKGFDGTSVNVMARDAGISKESIYRYFGSKEDLFMAVIERELEVYQQGMRETASDYRNQSLEEALFHVAETALKLLATDRTLALRRLIFQLAANGSKVGSHYYRAGPRVAYQNLKRIFDHHLESSGLETHFSAEKLSEYFISMVLHSTMLERECGIIGRLGNREIQRRCRMAVDDFLNAFFVQQSGARPQGDIR